MYLSKGMNKNSEQPFFNYSNNKISYMSDIIKTKKEKDIKEELVKCLDNRIIPKEIINS